MTFNLESFKKPETIIEAPLWSELSTTNQKLYQCILKHFNQIQAALEASDDMQVKKTRIISRRVAHECNLSPSILSDRRKPDITEFIRDLNEQLDLIAQSQVSKKTTSGLKPTKNSLLAENKSLKLQIQELQNLRLAESFSLAIESSLTENSRTQANTIRQLRSEIARLNLTISNQATLLQAHVH